MLTKAQKTALNAMLLGDTYLHNIADRTGLTEEELMPLVEAVFQKIPAKTLDFEKIIASEPLACDPLIVQGQVSIIRLDNIYDKAISGYYKAVRYPLNRTKRTLSGSPPDYAHPRFSHDDFRFDSPAGGKDIYVATQEPSEQDMRCLETAMKAIDRAMKIQITITKRREYLLNSDNPSSPRRKKKKKHRQNHQNTASETHPSGLTPLEGIRGYPEDNHFTSASANANNLSQPEASARNNPTSPAAPPSIPPSLTSLPSVQKTPPDPCPSVSIRGSKLRKRHHPQFTGYLAEGEEDWPYYIPDGVEEVEDLKKLEYPTYSRPPFPGEKTHYYPPFSEATPEDAEEIDAYIKSLPPEITADKNVGFFQNAYITAPVWRTTETEQQYAIRLRNHNRQHKSKTATSLLTSLSSVQENPPVFSSPHPCKSVSIRGSDSSAYTRESASVCDSQSQPEASARNAVTTNNMTHESREEEPISPPSHPCPSVSIRGSDSSAHSRESASICDSQSQPEASARNAVTTNNMTHESREEEPISPPSHPCPSVSIRGSDSHPYHQRE